MRISQRGLELIKGFEGLRLKSYLCPANVWTIGYGSTGPHVREGMVISERDAEDLLRSDLRRFEQGVAKLAPDCSQGQLDALVSFAFNLGLGALARSTLLRKHKAGDHAGAAGEFRKWVMAGGVKLNGLVRRRAAERDLYLSQE
jgi:lysozyme